MRCRALLCINNLVSNLSPEELGKHDGLWELWSVIGTEVFQQANKEEVEVLEASTCAMRAVLQRLWELKTTKACIVAICLIKLVLLCKELL